ncbi:MAG: DNA repair protein RecO [Ruminococcus sp.]|nr:DNA repair protein RecO [Ruminococcus sp.]
MTTVKGIVIRERSFGEQDKFIDVLTAEHGVIELTVRGARKINGKSGSAVQLFAYSDFCYNQNRDCFILNSAVPVRIFYGLRDSLLKISLASYFADILKFCIRPEIQTENITRLFLNSLHFLEKGLRNEKMLKSIFELRLMSETGFMPDILACRGCGEFEPSGIFFGIHEGCFFCKDCFSGSEKGWYKADLSVLKAIRHIVLADFDRLFNFRVSDRTLKRLNVISEKYLLAQLEKDFPTLDFYKTIDK